MKLSLVLFLSAYSFLLSCNSQTRSKIANEEIVIVNAGQSNRVGLAKDIAYINSLKPKVFAIDFQFSDERSYHGDSLLIASLRQCKNLVMAVVIDGYTGEPKNYSGLTGTLEQFRNNAKVGFVNLLPEKDRFQTLKRFSIYEKLNGKLMYPLGVQTAMAFDSVTTMSFLRRNNKIIDVDYIGDENAFQTVSYQDLIKRKISMEEIKDKIVLLGFIGLSEGYNGTYDEDKFFSPLNKKEKPYKPDMYGVVYHANIVAQILESKSK